MKGILYREDEKWWVKYYNVGNVSSTDTPAIAGFWCKLEVHPDSVGSILTSTSILNQVEVDFTLYQNKDLSEKLQPDCNTFLAVLEKPKYQNPYKWEYRVLEPDGRVISVDEYMKSEDYCNRLHKQINDFLTGDREKELLALFEKKEDEEPTPIYVGTLTKAFGIKGHSKAEIGHPVYEFNGKYQITITDPKGQPITISFYKESLESNIQKS